MKQSSSAGFTIVEMIIAVTVSGILAVVIMDFTINSLSSYSKMTTRGFMLNQAQLALDSINNDILLSGSADQVNRVGDANAPNSNLFGWVGDNNNLILATVAEDINRNILFADETEYVSHKNNNVYFLTGDTLYKRTLAATVTNNKAVTSCPKVAISPSCPEDRKLADNVKSFKVTYLNSLNQEVAAGDARSIELDLELQDEKYGKTITVEHTTRTVFRND